MSMTHLYYSCFLPYELSATNIIDHSFPCFRQYITFSWTIQYKKILHFQLLVLDTDTQRHPLYRFHLLALNLRSPCLVRIEYPMLGIYYSFVFQYVSDHEQTTVTFSSIDQYSLPVTCIFQQTMWSVHVDSLWRYYSCDNNRTQVFLLVSTLC